MPPLYKYSDTEEARRQALSILQMLRPMTVVGRNLIRIGRDYDGGYVMVDDFDHYDAAYSLGINDDVSWDRVIADKGIDVYQYDHTIENLPEQHDRFFWRKLGISTQKEPNMESLPQLIEFNDHGNARNLLLKCDIEGSEHDVLASLPEHCLQKFKQITIEVHHMHELDRMDWYQTVRRSITALTSFHQVVHIHGNNHAAYSIVGGVPVPSVLEITLVRRKDYTFTPCTYTFPTSLDMPNTPTRADYSLGYFSF